MSYAIADPPAGVPARVELLGHELRITLFPLAWGKLLRVLAFPAVLMLCALAWTTVIILFARPIWQIAPMTLILSLAVGIGISALSIFWLCGTIRNTSLSTTFGQTANELTTSRLGTRKQRLARDLVSAFHAEPLVFWACLRGKWIPIRFPGRPRSDLEWVAKTLAANWQIPSREPLAENEVPVRFRSLQGRVFSQQVAPNGTLYQMESAILRPGRLHVEPGRMTLRSDEHRVVKLEFISCLNATAIARVVTPRLGWANPVMPKVMIDDPDCVAIDEADTHTLRIRFNIPDGSETIEIVSDDSTILPAAADAFWSG